MAISSDPTQLPLGTPLVSPFDTNNSGGGQPTSSQTQQQVAYADPTSNYFQATPQSNYYEHLSNAIIGAQTVAEQEGSKSLTDTVSDLVTKAIPLTGAAIVNSFYNTAVEFGNFFGGDAQQASIESEFGPDSDTTAYYQQHAGPIEGLALAVGSLAPGLGAIKGLKLAQAGKFGPLFSNATGLFSRLSDQAISEASLDLVGNTTGQSLFGLTTGNKIKAVLTGAADQALQGAVYETATLATMHASPITDNNTFSDNLSDIKDSAIGFGLVGGLIEGAQVWSKINKAAKAADVGSKAQEAFGGQGLGNLTPGDRIVKLYETLDNIPAPSNRLETMKLNATTNTTQLAIKQELIKAAGDDKELAGKYYDFLQTSRAAGKVDSDTLTDQLGQLAKIGRHGDTSVTSQPREVFYLPTFIEPGVVPNALHEDVMSGIIPTNNKAAPAYKLTNPRQLPTIARETDSGQVMPFDKNQPIQSYPTWATPKDAWKQGADIWVGRDGSVVANPDTTAFKQVARPGESRILSPEERVSYYETGKLPEGSKPLNAVGLTLDTTNGKIYGESPLPVVGDLGKPVVNGRGLLVGEKLYPQKPGTEFSPTSPMDANARYVWAALRGLKEEDVIHPTDIPMMEQAYREMAAGGKLSDKSITSFSDGSPIPSSPAAMLQHLSLLKQTRYAELLSEGKNADEIGHILNAPTSGMTKIFNTVNPDELMMPPEQSASIRHIRLAYDIGDTNNMEGNILRGMQATNYRVKLATDGNTTTVANYLAKTIGAKDLTGKLAEQYFHALQFTKGAGDADLLGAGSGFLSNANASYGTLAQQAERMGKAASDLSVQRHSVISDTLASPTMALRQDPVAATEYGNFESVVHSTGEHFQFLSDADAAANRLPRNTVILEGAVTKDPASGQVTVNNNFIPEGFVHGSQTTGEGLRTYYTLSDKVMNVLRANQSLLTPRNQLRSDWWKATGLPKDPYPTDRIYLPPLDTTRQPFMAYVKQKDGYAFSQGGASVVTAKSAEELQKKISLFGPSFDAFTKSDIAAFKRAQGEFEFDRNFASSQVKTEMARKGILNNVVPETRAANLIDRLANWHFRQEDQLLRDHIELHNAATFDQLKAIGDRWEGAGTSRFGAITPFTQRTATNPYQTYIRTSLGISSKDQYPLWQLAQDKLDSYGDRAFNAVRDAFGATRKGLLDVKDAAEISKRFGLGSPYGTTLEEMSKSYYGGLANQLPEPGVFRKFVATANAALGATVIRIDPIQQLIHAVTLPIMTALEHGSASKDLQALLTTQVPGQAVGQAPLVVPGFMKSLYNGVKNFWGTDREKLEQLYSSVGMSRDELQIHRQMIHQLSMPAGSLSESGWAEKIDKGAQYAERLAGTKFTNQFIHFMACDVGRQIGEATGLQGQDLLDHIGTFSNRVLGNIAAGQRAGIFSGPVGQALGLFQSYQWNMMQQLLRHIGEGDVKAIAMGAGMQSSIFGLSSLPGFQALNSMIADRHGNTSGADLYSATNQMLDGARVNTGVSNNTLADYLLYGSLSGLTGFSLYSRGDLNPRRATILPVNPLNFPSVAAGIRVYQTLTQLLDNLTTKGGNVPASLLLAAEHNGMSRPLSGLAELVQGFSTAPNGNLISKNSGMNDLTNIATMSRILGAKPLEETTAMDALYRSSALKVLDTARLQELGATAKTAMYNNSRIAPEVAQQFMADYVKAGGNQNNFNTWFLQQSKVANTAAVNRVMENFHNPRAQSLQMQMGGVPLSDFQNSAQTQLPNVNAGLVP